MVRMAFCGKGYPTLEYRAMRYSIRLACRGCAFLLLYIPIMVSADVEVVDDTGEPVRLAQPARRIISLAPHTTELLFQAGSGEYIVGAVEYSDYPPAAREIQRVGGYNNPDLETILSLKPDLIVAWQSGNSHSLIKRLRALGLVLYVTEPRELEDIPSNLLRLGLLSGTEAVAEEASRRFNKELERLRGRYASQRPVRLFYEVWSQPLMTINGDHLISKVIRLCGGENAFGSLPTLAPRIGVEAVLEADPEAIIASGMGKERPEWLDDWRDWPHLTAVKQDNLFFIPPALLQRHTPRILLGAQQLCSYLERARSLSENRAARTFPQ